MKRTIPSMQSPKEPTPTGNTEKSRSLSSTELAEFHARCKARIEEAREGLRIALAEAERRGVPLHEVLPDYRTPQ